MTFKIVGSCIAFFLFVFSYKELKAIRMSETSTYFDGIDGVHASMVHESRTDM